MSPSPTGSPDTDLPKWDPRIIGLVGVICSIFLLFSYYKIVERNCRNRDRRRRLGLNDELEELSSQFDSRGLDSFVMHALPITQIKKPKQGSDWECAVCLGEFEAGEWVKHLPICSHVFHVSCIDTWFQTHSSCPLCRSSLCLQTLTREDYRILNIQLTLDDHN